MGEVGGGEVGGGWRQKRKLKIILVIFLSL